MKTRAMLSLLALLAASGCVIRAKNPGNVTFLWSFQGQSCSMVPEVRSVKITIGGTAIQNDGIFNCSTEGTAGIVLHDFRGGAYTYTIEGKNFNGVTLYSRTGTFIVDGNVVVNVDLTLPGGQGSAYLVWTFPPNSLSQNPTCEQAGITHVNVSIDGATPISYNCADGQTSMRAITPNLAIGTHTIDLSAVDSTGYEYYFAQSNLPISTQQTSQQYDLDWAVGGATVRWTVVDRGVTQTCAQAGIVQVVVNFQDVNGNLVYGPNGDLQPCSTSGVVYNFLKPGTYRVLLAAAGSASTLYYSDPNAIPSVTVVAGRFTTSTDGPNIVLNRTQ